jgi:hypothetical protein
MKRGLRTQRAMLLIIIGLIGPMIAACGTSPAGPVPAGITYGQITPGPHKVVGDLSTTIEVPPFPYGAPLPPPIATSIDGLYFKTIPFEGTPTPCKRCAGYRLEGGVWSLFLDKGIFKVFQQDTDFESVGSYTVSGNQIKFFNDPYCEEDLSMIGTYNFTLTKGSLELQVVSDPCSIGLRAKNLMSSPWTKKAGPAEAIKDPCQPPNREAAVTDHWNKPSGCE